MKRIFQDMILGPMISRRDGKQVKGGWVIVINKDLAFVKELIESGKLKPVIDRCYPLNETAEAFRHFDKGHARGRIIITQEVN